MTPKQRALAAALLDQYSDDLGNRSCNDWDFPENWTPEEVADFCKGAEEQNGTPEEFDPHDPSLPDFAVATYLAHLLRQS